MPVVHEGETLSLVWRLFENGMRTKKLDLRARN